jgi:hypothetical protein
LALVSVSAKGDFTGKFLWAKGLKSAYDIVLAVPNDGDGYAERIREAGVEVAYWALDRSRGYRMVGWPAVSTLVDLLRERQCDIVHSFGHAANFCSITAARLAGTPTVVASVTGLGSLFIDSSRLVQRGVLLGYRVLARWTSTFIFENRDDYAVFGIIPEQKKFILRGNGVDTSHFHPQAVCGEVALAVRKSLGIGENDVVVTFVGRLIQHKGIREMFEAWCEIARVRRNVCLLVVGEHDQANRSSIPLDGIPHGVRLLGRRDDVREILAVTDVYVNPSYREGLPRTNVEALAMGKPVITCDVPGSRDTVDDGVSGILVPPRNAALLRSAMERLISDPALRLTLGRAAREKACREFSLTSRLREVEGLYRRLTAAKGRGGP